MTGAMRLETKVREQGGVSEPRTLWGCWAEKRAYTGAMFPVFVQCAKNRRPGYLTCRWHHDREEAAQMLREDQTHKAGK